MKLAIALAIALAPSLAFADTPLTPVRDAPDVRVWVVPQGTPNPDRDPKDAYTPPNTIPKGN